MRYKPQFLLCLLLLSLVFTGCEKNDNDQTSVHGTWQAQKIVLQGITSEEPVVRLIYFEDIDPSTPWAEEILFEEDYEFTFTSTFNGSILTGQGTWTQTNDIITCFQNGVPQLEYHVEGSTIILSGLTSTHEYDIHFVKKTQ